MTDFIWPVRVYYEDTDSGGVVYYANYLKFMERARTEWLRSLGFEQDELRDRDGIIFAVRSAAAEYLRPARFNDCLQVVSRLSDHGKASFTFEQEIKRDGENGELLCTGVVRVACLDAASMRPCPIPLYISRELLSEH